MKKTTIITISAIVFLEHPARSAFFREDQDLEHRRHGNHQFEGLDKSDLSHETGSRG